MMGAKFYKGNSKDTPWNNDLNWKARVKQEFGVVRPPTRIFTDVQYAIDPESAQATKKNTASVRPSRFYTKAGLYARRVQRAQEKVQTIAAKIKDKIAEEKEQRAAFDNRLKLLRVQLAEEKEKKLHSLRRKLRSANYDLQNYFRPSLSATL